MISARNSKLVQTKIERAHIAKLNGAGLVKRTEARPMPLINYNLSGVMMDTEDDV